MAPLTPQLKASLGKEVARRRTFAIISHPDAGKTTLTEKLLLYGGAIHPAGAGEDSRRGGGKNPHDWMEIERPRGISVAARVLQVDYQGGRGNPPDTPRPHDLSQNTHR